MNATRFSKKLYVVKLTRYDHVYTSTSAMFCPNMCISSSNACCTVRTGNATDNTGSATTRRYVFKTGEALTAVAQASDHN
jgi:hypothetical protein